MKFEINPKVGAGPVRFGMDTNSVRRALGGQFDSFLKTPASAVPCDYYERLGVFAYYKPPGILEALEFVEPAELYFNGRSLLGEPASIVKQVLDQLDKNLELDSSGMISHQLGIGILAPGWDDNEYVLVQGVIIFEDGYYS
jgi:hypothetical protein